MPNKRTNCRFCGKKTSFTRKSYIVLRLEHGTIVAYFHINCLRPCLKNGIYSLLKMPYGEVSK